MLRVVHVRIESEVHYHKVQTGIYPVLWGEGAIELDGVQTAVKPGHTVTIPRSIRQRSVGNMTIINVVVPDFDPAYEYVL